MLSFIPLDVLDEIWDLTESVSDRFLTYSNVCSCTVNIVHFKFSKTNFAFDVWDRLWVLIWPVPEVSLLL